MTGSGKGRKRKGKEEEGKLADGEINVFAVPPDAQRTRRDGGSPVPAGYLAIYYKHPDGTVQTHKEAFQLSPENFVNCRDMFAVGRFVKEAFVGLQHVKASEFRFCQGEQVYSSLEEFLDALRGSNRTYPVQVLCPAPVGPVPDTTPRKRDLKAGYLAIYYKHPDGTVQTHKEAFQLSPENFVNCEDIFDVFRFVKEGCEGLQHVRELDFQFCQGEQVYWHLEEFLDALRGSNRTYPVQVLCPAPVAPVPDTTPRKRDLKVRYREFAPSSMTARNVRKVQIPQESEQGSLYKCGRLADAAGLEAPLMHPVFGSFVQNLQNPSLPTREDYAFAGYLAIYYKHPDGTVKTHKEPYELSPTRFVNCRDMLAVARFVKEAFVGLEHVRELDFQFCQGEQVYWHLEEFLDALRGSSRTYPVQVLCPAPVAPVPDTTPRKRDLKVRYRQFAPSSMTARNVRKVQIPQSSDQGPLYKCGRPADAAGLEAPLMHPVFGSFVQNLQNPSLPTREDYAFVREFCETSLQFYGNEYARQTELMSLLGPYLKKKVKPMKINNFGYIDGYIGRRTGFPVFSIFEVENELGSTTVDKFFQGQRYYAEFCAQASNDSSAIFTSCNCPAFLVELRGVQMRISAMAYFDRVHTSMLTDLVNLSWPSENLPQIFKSLKLGIDSLASFYIQVEEGGKTSTRGNWLEKVVPYPVWWNPRYIVKEVFLEKKHVFLAEDNQKRMVVIKFSRRYGDKVHRAWYNVDLAPELLDVEELAGGFKMIVMEYLGPPWKMLGLLDTETKERARVVVREALEKVHKLRVFGSTNAGSVHGDVRDVNIMVRSHGKGFDVRFVDFDWAGQESVSTYPPNMNHTTIAWPEGVADGRPMLQGHDMDVLSSTPGKKSVYDWRNLV